MKNLIKRIIAFLNSVDHEEAKRSIYDPNDLIDRTAGVAFHW